VLAAYLELWRREPILRRILMVSLLADTAFGALIPFVNFYLSDELKAPPHITVSPSLAIWRLRRFSKRLSGL